MIGMFIVKMLNHKLLFLTINLTLDLSMRTVFVIYNNHFNLTRKVLVDFYCNSL
jgi:hypothetical protein